MTYLIWNFKFVVTAAALLYLGLLATSQENCPVRISANIKEGRTCRKSCQSQADCRGSRKRCICDDACGLSCHNPNAACLELEPIENGYFDGQNRYKERVTYHCNDGYQIRGNSERICRSDRKWSGTAPTCVDYSKCGQSGEIEGLLLQARVSIGRTINGVRAKEKTWPWQVLISWGANNIENTYRAQFHDKDHIIGGGTLINNKWVLTAAHLFDGVHKSGIWERNYLLSFGIHKRQTIPSDRLQSKVKTYRSQQVIEHNEFFLYDNDIALIKIGQQYQETYDGKFIPIPGSISGYINFTEYIRPVCLPCTNSSCMTELLKESNMLIGNETAEERCRLEIRLLEQENEEHRTVVAATGFGHTRIRNISSLDETELSEYLQQILLEIKPLNYCRSFSEQRIPWHLLRDVPNDLSPLQRLQIPVTDRMMCGSTVGNTHDIVDICQGDNGGPLVRQLYYEDNVKMKQESCWIQFGIGSWGWGCGLVLENPREQIPGFYTDVTKFTSWISDSIERNAD